jgi:hypothetical protein
MKSFFSRVSFGLVAFSGLLLTRHASAADEAPQPQPPTRTIIMDDKPVRTGIGLTLGAGGGTAFSGSSDFGMQLAMTYTLPRLAFSAGVMGQGALSGASSAAGHSDYLSSSAWFVGARYFLSESRSPSAVVPFVGGGFGWEGVSFAQRNPAGTPDVYSTTSGAGAFGVVGLSMLRTSQVGVELALQVDAPFFASPTGNGRRYVLPSLLTVAVAFH